jgi:hypothetical protein
MSGRELTLMDLDGDSVCLLLSEIIRAPQAS